MQQNRNYHLHIARIKRNNTKKADYKLSSDYFWHPNFDTDDFFVFLYYQKMKKILDSNGNWSWLDDKP